MELSALNTFMHAAEARSFTIAARKLGVTASAVGKNVARLEQELGVRLLNRNTRVVTLTSEGERFLVRCQRIFREIDAAALELANSGAAPRGRLRISLPIIAMLMMPVIGAFAEAYPEIELDLDFSDRFVNVIDEGFDAVMRTGMTTDSQLMTRNIGVFSTAVVGSPDYFRRRGRPEYPEDLLSHACLHHRWSKSGKLERWRLSNSAGEFDLDLPVSAISGTMEPLIALAERGLGLAYVPEFGVREKLKEGKLETTLDDYTQWTGVFQALWPSGRQRSPKVQAFVNFMARRLLADQD